MCCPQGHAVPCKVYNNYHLNLARIDNKEFTRTRHRKLKAIIINIYCLLMYINFYGHDVAFQELITDLRQITEIT